MLRLFKQIGAAALVGLLALARPALAQTTYDCTTYSAGTTVTVTGTHTTITINNQCNGVNFIFQDVTATFLQADDATCNFSPGTSVTFRRANFFQNSGSASLAQMNFCGSQIIVEDSSFSGVVLAFRLRDSGGTTVVSVRNSYFLYNDVVAANIYGIIGNLAFTTVTEVRRIEVLNNTFVAGVTGCECLCTNVLMASDGPFTFSNVGDVVLEGNVYTCLNTYSAAPTSNNLAVAVLIYHPVSYTRSIVVRDSVMTLSGYEFAIGVGFGTGATSVEQLKIANVTVTATAATTKAGGFTTPTWSNGGSIEITNFYVTSTCSGASNAHGNCYGVQIEQQLLDTASLTIRDSTFTVSAPNGATNVKAVQIGGANSAVTGGIANVSLVRIRDSTFTVTATVGAIGIQLGDETESNTLEYLEVIGTTVRVTATNTVATCFWQPGTTV